MGKPNPIAGKTGRSGAQIALFYERKRIKALVAVERVCVLGPLEPVNDQICQWCGDHFVTDLESIAGGNDVEKSANGVDSAEGQGNDENSIHGLADDGGTDRARPKHTAVGDELQSRHR